MKKFNFQLKQFLKIKEFEEKMAWNEVLKQEGRMAVLSQQIQTLKQSQKDSREQLSRTGSMQGLQAHATDLYNESIAGLEKRILALNTEYFNEAKILEKLRLKFLEAKKEVKTIDKLKDKKLEEFKVKNQKNDAKSTTEIATQLFNQGKLEDE